MGASKEGTMSVRERINLVLRESFLLRQEDGETGTERGGDGEGSNFVPTTTTSSASSMGSGGVNNNGGHLSSSQPSSASSSSVSSPSFSGSNKSFLGLRGKVNAGKEEGRSESPASSGSLSTWSGSSRSEALELAKVLEENEELALSSDLKRLVMNQLSLLYDSSRRWEASESEREIERRERDRERKERDQLQATLESERLDRSELLRKNETLEEQRLRDKATIKEQEDKIKELESQLATLRTPKPVVHQGTVTTPPPRPPVPPSPEVQNHEEDDEHVPPIKRIKLESEEDEVTASSSNRLPRPSTLTPYVQSHQGKFIMPHNSSSDSPPQLSLAVTPRSTTQNPSLQERGARAFSAFIPGDRVEGEFSEYPPVAFQNELDRMNYHPSQRSGEAIRGSQSVPSQPVLPSGSSAFSRPLPRRDVARLVIPEHHRRNFIPNSPLRSMQQFRQSLLQHPATTTTTSNSLAPKISSSSDISNTSLSRDPPQLISIRSNNFLNMSKPIARKPHLPTTSFQPSSLTDDASLQQSLSRSLDYSSTSTPEASKPNDDLTVTQHSETPPPPVKRPRGRPVGFRPQKRKRAPDVSPWSTGSVGPSDSRLSNGALEDLQLKSEPPPTRFSRSGRRIKNNSRYSPDPDNSTHSREKFMTTKKNYFVSDPFVPEGYGESRDGLISSDTILSAEADSLIRQELEDDETTPYPPAPRTVENEGEEGDPNATFVEVPRWRIINIDEDSEAEEERKPPDDDMSEETFVKRHQKPEVQEKQRKRWDLQMLREESYKERMQRKQQEREKQKELRRQQRKRKGRTGATEEEVVNPSVEDIKAVYVSPELPVGAFGQTLPINEKVDFHFSSGRVSPPPPALPSPKPVLTVKLDNANHDTSVIRSSKVRNSSTGTLSSAVTHEVNVNSEQMGMLDRMEPGKDSEVIAVEGEVGGPAPTPPPPSLPSCSSPVSSSLLPVSSSSMTRASTPPPPVIFCVRDSDSKDVYEYTDDDHLLAPTLPSLDRTKATTSDKRKERELSPLPSRSIESTSSNITGSSSCSPARVSTSTITAVSSPKIKPSVTIPLVIPLIKGRNPSGGSSSQTYVVNNLGNITTSSASGSGALSKSANIKFFIPSNPLARPRPKPRLPAAVPLACSTTSSSSSVKMSDDDDEHPSRNKS